MSILRFAVESDEQQSAFEEEYKKISAQIPIGLKFVGAEMAANLKKHIQEDVYDAYKKPKIYRRRKDNPQFGIALDNDKNMAIEVEKNVLVFSYLPDGTYTALFKDIETEEESKKFGHDRNAPVKPFPVHGDALIKRIQNATYDWKVKDIPKRRFLDNFVDEQRHSGILNAFLQAFIKYDAYDTKDNDVVFDGIDGRLQ